AGFRACGRACEDPAGGSYGPCKASCRREAEGRDRGTRPDRAAPEREGLIMFQCIDCGSQNPYHAYHACPTHPTFKVKEPGIVMTPRSIERLEEENARLLLQYSEV